MSQEATGASASQIDAYRVLARTYRPRTFAELIGQEALVRTLTNALESGRLAHAFLLTGVRGTGKTTTARIIARAVNCVGAEGKSGPTASPCGACDSCIAITQDRHVDVLEMDAASRTGVQDMRELLDGVRYRPVSARFKVYIIDEVHMLSISAFNALLKTLEEPPPQVLFIFATTEIRKVPVTVLSRCQRFDLRRVGQDELQRHFATIAEKEGVTVEGNALALIARAADGSVRDGLSLLDQAMALGGGRVEAAQVKDMLGLADRSQVAELFEQVMGGEIAAALDLLATLYQAGADPATIVQDLLGFCHFLTRAKLAPGLLEEPSIAEQERVAARRMVDRLDMAELSRSWQMLLKGLSETRGAPSPIQAAEMLLIRLAYLSDLPSPGDLVERLRGEVISGQGKTQKRPVEGVSAAPTTADSINKLQSASEKETSERESRSRPAEAPPKTAQSDSTTDSPSDRTEQVPAPATGLLVEPKTWREAVAVLRDGKEGILANQVCKDAHLVRFEPGAIEFRPGARAPSNLAGRLGDTLSRLTGRRWMVTVSSEPGEASLAEQDREAEAQRHAEALDHPLVKAVFEAFPNSELLSVKDTSAEAQDDSNSNDGGNAA